MEDREGNNQSKPRRPPARVTLKRIAEAAGVHPATVDAAADRLAALILEVAGGALGEGSVHDGAPLPPRREVSMRVDRCRDLLGVDIEPERMVAWLEEEVDGHDGSKYAWINAAYSMAVNVNRAFKEFGWCTRIRGVTSGGEVENLPSDRELTERRKVGQGLTRPELAVLLSYAKMTLYEDVLRTELPDRAYLTTDLLKYFPRPLRRRYAQPIEHHRLRREITATWLANSVVNRGLATFVSELEGETGASLEEVLLAYATVRDSFGLLRAWEKSGVAQLIIATHSPIIMSYPSAALLSFDGGRIHAVDYRETDHYRVTRRFLMDPDSVLAQVLADDAPRDD